MAKSLSAPDLSFHNIWEDAYSKFKTEYPKLLDSYQSGILEETRTKCPDSRRRLLHEPARSATELQRQLVIVLEIQNEYIQEKQWKIKVGDKERKIRDAIRKTINFVSKAKDFISAAAINEPHAALAWAGVSCLLPVSQLSTDHSVT